MAGAGVVDGIEGTGWEYGTDVAYLRELCE